MVPLVNVMNRCEKPAEVSALMAPRLIPIAHAVLLKCLRDVR